ncbi:MAG TPA: ATP-binding protein [Candidatus Dormibacteraeota bacterium]|nr:ATP-binding protein [Candidatus Dormibacteraeota bacterium]
MIRRLRASFAAKLLALELGSIVVVAASLAAVLVAVRVSQTRELEKNVAQANVNGLSGTLRQAGSGAMSLSTRLAAFPLLVSRFGATAQAAALMDSEAATLDDTHTLVLVDAAGRGVLARRGSLGLAPGGDVDPTRWSHIGAIDALGKGTLPPAGLLEPVAGVLELDGLAAVRPGAGAIGYVVDSIDVGGLLRLATPSGSAVHYSVFYDGARLATTLPGAGGGLPAEAGSGGVLASSFATYQVAGKTYAGFYGAYSGDSHVLLAADLDDSVFAAQNLNDLLAAFFAVGILATVLGVLAVYFARRVALRPLAELGRGAARLGGGDYSARVGVASQDDFGRLALSFNAMADRIRDSTQQLERQRARLDASLTSLGAVSRALTTTTAGAPALRAAVLDAVMEVTGARAAAMFSGVERPQAEAAKGLRAAAATQAGRLPGFQAALAEGGGGFTLAGGPAGFEAWSGVVVPMIYQDRPVGAIAAFHPVSLAAADLAPLAVLANQAIVALESAEMFERERETVRRLQELDSMKSDFLATIQHELRTPLTAIIGMTDLLEMAWDSYPDAQKVDMLGEVQIAAKGLYDIVETILDYSMLESDRMRLHIAPSALRPAVETAVDELQPSIRRRQTRVTVDVPKTLSVAADGQRLVQVVRALVDNAVKFSPDGGTVRVKAERGNGKVTLRVVDRGVGIPADLHERIFERFFQVDNTATRRHGGTGMGLALAHKLVTMQKGRLTVESEPGKGSTFTVVLPAAVAPGPGEVDRDAFLG